MNPGAHTNKDSKEYKFNIGIAYLERIHYILGKITEHRINNQPREWINYLESLYMEIKAKIDPEDKVKAEELWQKVVHDYNDWYNIPPTYKPEATPELINSCKAFEDYLRAKLHEFGLLMPLSAEIDSTYT